MSIELMKAIYDLETPPPDDASFYHKALQDIENDGVESQIYYLLKQQGRLKQTPAFFQDLLRESYEKGLYQNLFIKNQTDQILKMFENNVIDVIPLKGVYFAEEFFGHIGARVTTDIDLLIKKKDLEKAIALINVLGFTVEEEHIPGHFHCSFSKKLPQSAIPLIVELHWSIVKENTSKFDINDLWDDAVPVAHFSHIKELSPNHTFYMICLHGWRHNLDSMRYFLDIIQVIHKNSSVLDYQEFFILAAAHRTYKRMLRTLSIVYQEFPHLHNRLRFPFKIKKTLWAYRPAKGLMLYADFIDYQFFSFDTVTHSLIEAGNWIKYELLPQAGEGFSKFMRHLKLYKKRAAGIIKAIFSH